MHVSVGGMGASVDLCHWYGDYKYWLAEEAYSLMWFLSGKGGGASGIFYIPGFLSLKKMFSVYEQKNLDTNLTKD